MKTSDLSRMAVAMALVACAFLLMNRCESGSGPGPPAQDDAVAVDSDPCQNKTDRPVWCPPLTTGDTAPAPDSSNPAGEDVWEEDARPDTAELDLVEDPCEPYEWLMEHKWMCLGALEEDIGLYLEVKDGVCYLISEIFKKPASYFTFYPPDKFINHPPPHLAQMNVSPWDHRFLPRPMAYPLYANSLKNENFIFKEDSKTRFEPSFLIYTITVITYYGITIICPLYLVQ